MYNTKLNVCRLANEARLTVDAVPRVAIENKAIFSHYYPEIVVVHEEVSLDYYVPDM